jgi:glyoxylate carboligase
MRLIAAITNASPASVTTTFAHQYISNTIVRLDLPIAVGMRQANQLTGTITVTGATTFTINIDTTHFQPFSIPSNPSPNINTCACVVPIGETNDTLLAATQNILT